MSLAFPRTFSGSSDGSQGSSPRRADPPSLSTLNAASRFALGQLVSTLLRLDFWNEQDPHSIFFCKVAFEVVVTHLDLPERTQSSLKAVLQGEQETGDMCTLISQLKKDEVVSEGGTIFVLEGLLIGFLQTGNYDSRYRVLLRHIGTLLAVDWNRFEDAEDDIAVDMVEEEFVESEHARRAREKSAKRKKLKRYLMVGAASGVGGVLIGLTGGLAAPLVAAGAGVLVGTGAAAGIATTAGAAILGSAFGVAGAGLAGHKMHKRVGAVEEFQVEQLTSGNSLRCVLVVSGWIDKDTCNDEAFFHQWRHLQMAKEQYSLRYESKYLRELGSALDYLMSFAVSVAIQQTLMETALAGLMSAVAWPVALVSASSVLDNPWNVCVSRATEVGEQLAELLLSRQHGRRPIQLVGFSLGARVIFHCLLAMSRRDEAIGIVEDVVLLGAPVTASASQWAQVSKVVGGRIVNGYCQSDWLLRFLYRTMSAQLSIAGTGPVENKGHTKIYNYNLSHIVKGHMDYSKKLTEVLEAVGVKVSPHSSESLSDLEAYCLAQECNEETGKDQEN